MGCGGLCRSSRGSGSDGNWFHGTILEAGLLSGRSARSGINYGPPSLAPLLSAGTRRAWLRAKIPLYRHAAQGPKVRDFPPPNRPEFTPNIVVRPTLP